MTLAEVGRHLFGRILTFWCLMMLITLASYVIQERHADQVTHTWCVQSWDCDQQPAPNPHTRGAAP